MIESILSSKWSKRIDMSSSAIREGMSPLRSIEKHSSGFNRTQPFEASSCRP